jgi:hypothetical protein
MEQRHTPSLQYSITPYSSAVEDGHFATGTEAINNSTDKIRA